MARGMIVAYGRWIVGVAPNGSISIFDTTKDEWIAGGDKKNTPSPIPDLPKAAGILADASLVVWNGGLFLSGGCTTVDDPTFVRAACWYWKPPAKGAPAALNCWNRHSLMNYARDRHASVVMGDTVWVAGGRNEHDDTMDSVEYWSLADRKWKHTAPLFEARQYPTLLAWNY